MDRRSFAKSALLTGLGASAVFARDQQDPSQDQQVTKTSAIKADGVTDDTAAIQAELNAKKQTGGTLILPPGKYLVGGHLVIPDGVALEGVHSAPVYKRPMTGTVMLATGGRGNEDAPPLFRMGASTAIRNLTVYYPEQKSDDIRPYPWTFDISPTVAGGGASDNTLEHITMINSYNGIKISHNNRHRIRSVHGCVLRRGLYVVSCTDVGRIDNVHFHGCYWWKKIRNSDGSWGKVNQYLMDNLEAFIIGRSDWEYITNTFVFIAKVGYRFFKAGQASSAQMVGIGADACRTCLLVEGTVSWLELLITNGTFATDSANKMGVGVHIDENSDQAANGPVRLVNCTILAPRGIISHSPKVVSVQNCHFNVWGPEPTSPLIQVDNGTLQVTGCNFDNNLGKTRPPAPSIQISKPLKFALITGNVGLKGVKIINKDVPSRNVIIANNQPADF